MKHRTLAYLSCCIIGLIGLITLSCSRQPDARLLRAESMMADSLPQARAMLDSIDRASLSAPDRNLRDLLAIKAADKAYVKHTADSTILRVADYYGHHQSSGRYPEALYYAGRVYSDLGDYPTALKYFQDALDEVVEYEQDTYARQLEISILSQTGRLLNTLRLHKEAVPYLRKSIAISRHLKDTLAVIYDTELLGAVTMHLEKYPEAKKLFRNALKLSERYPDLAARQRMYIAVADLSQDSISRAVDEIRGVPEQFPDSEKPIVLAYAARIYHSAGIVDTARIYAKELLKQGRSSHCKTGYAILLSRTGIETLSSDTISDYIEKYTADVENTLKRNGNVSAIMQNSLYNYTLKEREKAKAENRANLMKFWAVIVTFLLFTLGIVLLWLKNKNSRQYISLLKYREIISELLAQSEYTKKRNINIPQPDRQDRVVKTTDEPAADIDTSGLLYPEKSDLNSLRDSLIANLERLLQETPTRQHIPESIISSDAYCRMRARLESEQIIPDNDFLWDDIEEVVLSVNKDFKRRFQVLVGNKFKITDYRVALMIKCGLSTAEMRILVPMSKGGVSSKRIRLGEKAFDKKLPTNVIDRLIQLL